MTKRRDVTGLMARMEKDYPGLLTDFRWSELKKAFDECEPIIADYTKETLVEVVISPPLDEARWLALDAALAAIGATRMHVNPPAPPIPVLDADSGRSTEK